MISTFFGLNVGASALQTAQQSLSVIANNIANASTPGYTRETANLSEATAYPALPSSEAPVMAGQIGQGSSISSVTRQTSSYYDKMVRDNLSGYNAQNTLLNNLNEIQGVIGEPSTTSIHTAMDKFFSSFQALSTEPSSAAARQTVIQQATNLSGTFATVQQQLLTVVGNLDSNLSNSSAGEVQQVNTYAGQLNQLNQQIVRIKQTGQNPNRLLDQRDTIINNLAKLGNVSYTENTNGSMSVVLGNVQVVSAGNGSFSTTTFQRSDVAAVSSGSMWANQQGIAEAQKVIEQLGTLQGAIANAVNNQLQSGYQYNSSAHGVPLFTVNSQTVPTPSGAVTTPVESMSVVSGFTTNQLAAAQTPNVSGDGSNAVVIAGLQNATSLTNGTTSLGATPDDYYTSIVSAVGARTSAVQSRQQTANSLLQQAQNIQQSVSGVNQNNQIAKMIQFQNMYTAASKFISIQDQMLKTLIQEV